MNKSLNEGTQNLPKINLIKRLKKKFRGQEIEGAVMEAALGADLARNLLVMSIFSMEATDEPLEKIYVRVTREIIRYLKESVE